MLINCFPSLGSQPSQLEVRTQASAAYACPLPIHTPPPAIGCMQFHVGLASRQAPLHSHARWAVLLLVKLYLSQAVQEGGALLAHVLQGGIPWLKPFSAKGAHAQLLASSPLHNTWCSSTLAGGARSLWLRVFIRQVVQCA